MGDQALLQLIEVRQVQLMPRRDFAGMAQQIADFGAALIRDVLVHRGEIGRGGLDHPFDFLPEVFPPLLAGRSAPAVR